MVRHSPRGLKEEPSVNGSHDSNNQQRKQRRPGWIQSISSNPAETPTGGGAKIQIRDVEHLKDTDRVADVI